MRKTLADGGENIEDAIKYQKRGAAWKRKQVIAECEAWMDATNCPTYLREDNRKKAYESCDNDYIAKIHSVMFGLKLDLATQVEVTESGRWIVAKSVADAMLEKERRVLDADEVEAYRLYQQLITIADQLHQRYYYISETYGAEQDNLHHLNSLEADLEHFLMLRCPSPEEKRARSDKFGV
ncbi:MAG: hypothetical protein J6A72_06665 [Alistipes sp.]|nr:hypothetical protein [Alistipes sp.]